MRIVSFRASNDRFLVVNGDGRLEASAQAPGTMTEFLVDNLTRPESERYAVGDDLEIRSLANNNLWRLSPAPNASGTDTPGILADRPKPAFTRTLSEVVRVTWVDPAGEGPAGIRIRMEARYPSIIYASGGGGSGPDADTIFRDGFELTQVRPIATGMDGFVGAPPTATDAAATYTVTPHRLRAALRTADGLYLTLSDDGRLVAVATDSDRAQAFTILPSTILPSAVPASGVLQHGDLVTLRAANGRMVGSGAAGVSAVADSGVILQLRRIDGQGELRDGDRVTLSMFELSSRETLEPRRLVFRTVGDRRSARVLLEREALTAESSFIIEFTRGLGLFWNERTQDNRMAIGTRAGGAVRFVRDQARVLLSPRPGTVALKSFSHAGRGDTMATATVQGEQAALDASPPYAYGGTLGFIHTESQVGTVPLKQYWHAGRADNFLCALPIDDGSAAEAGYSFAWVEGHALPAPPAPPAPPVAGTIGVIAVGPAAAGVLRPGVSGTTRLPEITLPRRPARPRTALVLAGGGAKGSFAAGAVQELWNQGYRPDMICGVSVGAVNASYLALGHAGAGDELVQQWRAFSAMPGRIFRNGHYLSVIGKLAERVGGRAGDTALATGISAGLGGALGGLVAFFSAREASGIDGATLRFINFMLTMTHAQHSMEPLRLLLRRTYDADYLRRLRESPIGLHVGITDMKSGQLLTVSGPESDWSDAQISDCGRVVVEPDHQIGETWLTSPVLGAPYVMPLVDAVYASSALPGFMEPLAIDLPGSRRVATTAGVFTRLATRLPDGLRELIDATHAGSTLGADYLAGVDWAAVERVLDSVLERLPAANLRGNVPMARLARDGNRGQQSRTHLLFDGGLRDTMPIRTAMRLGAEEITVITGDQVHRAQHVYPIARRLDPALAGGVFDLVGGGAWHGSNFGATPLAQHVLGLLGLWFNESSRSDLMLSLERSDQLAWLRRAMARMEPAAAAAVRAAYQAEVAARTATRYEALGATGPLGGTPNDPFPYGRPLTTSGATIRLIAPDRGIIDALDFENREAVEDAIALGAERARRPVTL